ncbi:hypothetical protein ABZW11_16965 [Nonomuraea sp. NPDC004580]|uniref:hypothetical protein n=1 Tax=Nonomuraea sp. NPDC004580 TaxID=3154552 RepID=UPI0033BBA793
MTTYRLDTSGPHSDDYTRHVASVFAGTVRILNHATRDQDGVTEPATVHAILGELHDGIARLDQLLQQLDQRLVRFAQAGQLADSNGDAFTNVNTALRQLTGLRTDAAVMSERLARAFRATSGLYLRDESES